MRPQVRVCDSCTTRKSAPFQVGANFEPLSGRLQPGIRFFRVLLPAPPTACLTAHLPQVRLQTDGGESGLPRSRFCRPASGLNFTSQRAYPFSVRLFPGSITTTYSYNPKEHPAARLFGSGLQAASARCCLRGLSTVHICCACGTCLAGTEVPKTPPGVFLSCSNSRTNQDRGKAESLPGADESAKFPTESHLSCSTTSKISSNQLEPKASSTQRPPAVVICTTPSPHTISSYAFGVACVMLRAPCTLVSSYRSTVGDSRGGKSGVLPISCCEGTGSALKTVSGSDSGSCCRRCKSATGWRQGIKEKQPRPMPAYG
jgi:hypothetical protein